MVADAQGYHPLLEVDLDSVTVSSSLNDIRLLTARSCKVSRCGCQDTTVSLPYVDIRPGFRGDAISIEMGR